MLSENIFHRSRLWHRLLFAQVWEPPIIPGSLPSSFGSWFCYIQFRFCQTTASPHQPRSSQHWWPETPAFLSRTRTHAHVPTCVSITSPVWADPFGLQRLLFTRCVTLSKSKWQVYIRMTVIGRLLAIFLILFVCYSWNYHQVAI